MGKKDNPIDKNGRQNTMINSPPLIHFLLWQWMRTACIKAPSFSSCFHAAFSAHRCKQTNSSMQGFICIIYFSLTSLMNKYTFRSLVPPLSDWHADAQQKQWYTAALRATLTSWKCPKDLPYYHCAEWRNAFMPDSVKKDVAGITFKHFFKTHP